MIEEKNKQMKGEINHANFKLTKVERNYRDEMDRNARETENNMAFELRTKLQLHLDKFRREA